MKNKKLYKSNNKMVDGVCAGVAEYFNIDSTLVRALSVVGIILTGLFPGLIIYVVLAVIMPRKV